MTLAIPLGTAKSRLHRAMSVMRVALADVDPEHAAMAKGQPA
jgi:DNA-directed RNA polymerase specialized sigma24 family protein